MIVALEQMVRRKIGWTRFVWRHHAGEWCVGIENEHGGTTYGYGRTTHDAEQALVRNLGWLAVVDGVEPPEGE